MKDSRVAMLIANIFLAASLIPDESGLCFFICILWIGIMVLQFFIEKNGL